jgi:hypothetical protein
MKAAQGVYPCGSNNFGVRVKCYCLRFNFMACAAFFPVDYFAKVLHINDRGDFFLSFLLYQ